MVMLRWSVHLTTLFSWISLTKRLTSTSCTISGRRMGVENNFMINLHESIGPGRDPTLDLQPDTYLQSDMLPTALRGPVFANSEDPDEMQHAFHQGLHCM